MRKCIYCNQLVAGKLGGCSNVCKACAKLIKEEDELRELKRRELINVFGEARLTEINQILGGK